MFAVPLPITRNCANIVSEAEMSNVKHKNCALRALAKSAKSRLGNNSYDKDELSAPKDVTPEQKAIYVKLNKLKRAGESVNNPVAQLADENILRTLSHEEKQRYIIKLCADYVSVKNYMEKKSVG